MSLKSCCGFRQRYAILVDNIFFPKSKKASTQENIEKLLFYVLSSSEKLDRISNRLYSHLIMFLKSKKYDEATLVFDVTNQLLDSSRSTFINLMMDDYFKMIIRLLESDHLSLQSQASKSFRKFSQINVDVPKISDYIQPLVAQFVRVCTTISDTVENTNTLRICGLVGIQGLILKTKNMASHNVWGPEYATNIVHALIQNLMPISNEDKKQIPLSDEVLPFYSEFACQSSEDSRQVGTNSENLQSLLNPFSCSNVSVAIYNLRELLLLSTIPTASSIIEPIYDYWSKHNLWVESQPTSRMIELISHSLKPQLEHIAIRLIFSVIQKNTENDFVLNIISSLVCFSGKHTDTALGQIHSEIISLLIVFLKESCLDDKNTLRVNYFDASIDVLVILVNKLPHYQKSEAYQMIVSQMTYTKDKRSATDSNVGTISITSKQKCEFILLMNILEKLTRFYRGSKTASVLNLLFLEQLARCIRLPIDELKASLIKTLINLVDQRNISNYILKYMNDLTFELDYTCDPDLKDISIKRVIHIIDILATILFQSNSSFSLIRDFTLWVLIICFEINILKLYQQLCFKLLSITVDISIPNLRDMYQSMIFAVIHFISIISDHAKLIEICNKVKAARISINNHFWLPCSLLSSSTSDVILNDNIPPDAYFDEKQIECVFVTRDSMLHEEALSPSIVLLIKVPSYANIASSEPDNISIDSAVSDWRNKSISVAKNTSIIGNIGFIRRDQNCTQNISSEDIEKKYINSSTDNKLLNVPPKIGQKKGDDEYIY